MVMAMAIHEELSKAKLAYDSAVASGSGVNMAKERFKNLLFNYYPVLVGLVAENKRLAEENESLNAALQEADEELNNAEVELKKLRAKGSNSRKPKEE